MKPKKLILKSVLRSNPRVIRFIFRSTGVANANAIGRYYLAISAGTLHGPVDVIWM